MDSAIAPHLRCPRSRQRRIADDYAPPYPAWVAHGDAATTRVVMAYHGVQWQGEPRRGQALAAFADITASFDLEPRPLSVERAHQVDATGYDTLIAISYWRDVPSYERWRTHPRVAAWWSAAERLEEGIGYFREVVSPRVERFETLYSMPDRLEGAGLCLGQRSADPVQEHAYWGSMRDRIALAQTDALTESGQLTLNACPGHGRRVRVAGHDNVALIRSGQEWSDTKPRERSLYLSDMEPTLRKGMEFLRDSGADIGCYANRYLRQQDANGTPLDRTFGLSYWRSLAQMEQWSEHHPTHVAIFGTFMRIVQELEFTLDLRFFHEVSVLRADEQDYEYLNCHPETGLLRAAASVR